MSTGEARWRRVLELNGRDYQARVEAIKRLLVEHRGYVFEPPRGEPVIVLLSGGMDSCTLVDLVVREWDCTVIPVHFARDARNGRWEIEAVEFFGEFYKARYPDRVLDVVTLHVQVPLRTNKEHMDPDRKRVMGLPMRNATMWANSVAQAVYLSGKLGETIRTILVGSVRDDADNPESGYLSVLSQSLHACICTGTWNLQFGAPLVDDSLRPGGFTKRDLVIHCKDRGIPIERSRSCFGGDREPCGTCLACQHRERAFGAMPRGEGET